MWFDNIPISIGTDDGFKLFYYKVGIVKLLFGLYSKEVTSLIYNKREILI